MATTCPVTVDSYSPVVDLKVLEDISGDESEVTSSNEERSTMVSSIYCVPDPASMLQNEPETKGSS